MKVVPTVINPYLSVNDFMIKFEMVDGLVISRFSSSASNGRREYANFWCSISRPHAAGSESNNSPRIRYFESFPAIAVPRPWSKSGWTDGMTIAGAGEGRAESRALLHPRKYILSTHRGDLRFAEERSAFLHHPHKASRCRRELASVFGLTSCGAKGTSGVFRGHSTNDVAFATLRAARALWEGSRIWRAQDLPSNTVMAADYNACPVGYCRHVWGNVDVLLRL